MAPTYYESDHVAPFLPQQSIFDYLLPSHPGVSPLPDWDPSLPAFIDASDGRTLSRADLRENALRLKTGLNALGVKRGNVACLWGMNSLEYVQAVYGCLAAGVVVSPANVAYSPEELAHQINNSGASVVFIQPALLPLLDKARAHIKHKIDPAHVILLRATQDKELAAAGIKTIYEVYGTPAAEAEHFDGSDSLETAWLCYSSGTTGLPKGVMTTHWNLTSQLQVSNVAYETLQSGPGGDVVMGSVPMSHIYGVTLSLLQPFSMGVPVVILPKFEEIAALEAIQKYKITHLLLVPPLFLLFVHSKNLDKYDLSSVRTAMSGAAPLSRELSEAFLARIPTAVALQGYGMTETTPNICTMNRSEAAGRDGWVGRLVPSYQARLVSPDTGLDVAPGEPGELWVRGPSVMKGYHNNPEATAATMAPGGWLKTGDVLVRDEHGWYKVVDRLKELIKYKGFQVPPAELEALLIQHPHVADAGVVGVWNDAQVTEMPRAYIVPHESLKIATEGEAASFAAHVQRFVHDKVAQHKKLRGGLVILDAIPKSPSGKILRKDLRTRAGKETEPVWGATRDRESKL
ncbi:uncharacterized protein EHS24_004615 [Apiotrichum porosum]|uniref:AMP-dependent synthetase/ligase domain-containing protein n=1 Tax=Apiotrichum porosum TaxID=105984 RepID=A0A427Y5L4_9TREE|nr:uncharacterized protein EHS24_004615 [Apiotrichum porosum]RSH86366.1 hypothetical protein EHS24_004615 [Apiotrichum porosum]